MIVRGGSIMIIHRRWVSSLGFVELLGPILCHEGIEHLFYKRKQLSY